MVAQSSPSTAVGPEALVLLFVGQVQALMRVGTPPEGEPWSLDRLHRALGAMVEGCPLEMSLRRVWVEIELPLGGTVLVSPEDGRVRMECVVGVWLEAADLTCDEIRTLAERLLSLHIHPKLAQLGLQPASVDVNMDEEDPCWIYRGEIWRSVVDCPVAVFAMLEELRYLELQPSVVAGELAAWLEG